MTKAEIIAQVALRTGVNRNDVAETLEAFFKTVKNTMANGENLYVRGFGSFVIKRRARKMGRMIKANKPIVVEEHYIPSFKPAKSFTERIKDSPQVREKAAEREREKGEDGD